MTPNFETVKRFIDIFQNYLPTDGPHITPWFDRPVGIVFMHRNLWLEAKGYDESLIHWGWMETDLAYRLHQKYQLVHLQYLMEKMFFHLEHKPWRLPKIHRQKNIRKKKANLCIQ